MSHEKGRPLPKFGEWDVNNPASADGFTVIFAKARDEKKATETAAGGGATEQNFDHASQPRETTYRQHPPTTTVLMPLLTLESELYIHVSQEIRSDMLTLGARFFPLMQKKWFCCF